MRIKILTSLFLIGILSVEAQELTFKLNGGVSGISYKSSMGEGILGFGGGIGVGYTYFFNEHWGLQTGIEAQYNSNTFELDNGPQITSNEIDDQGSAFEYRVRPNGYEEDQHFYSFSIPVMLQYRTAISNKTGIYLGLGGKVLFPAKQEIEASAGSLSLSGYYPDLNLEIDDLPAHGYGTVNNWEDDTNVSLKTSVLLSMEAGFSFQLKENMHLYTGIYADYGLTDLQDNEESLNLVSYSPQGIEMVAANGVLATERIVEESPYLAAGIQVKLGFNLGKKNKLPAEEENVVVAEEPVERQEPAPVVVAEKEEDEKPEQPSLSDTEITYIEEPLVFGKIDQTEISEQLTQRLDAIADMMNKDETVKLHITGYTCNLGSESLNKRIGMERAESVAGYIENKGVSKDRMELESKGEADPLLPNTSGANRVANRRVSIDVIF